MITNRILKIIELYGENKNQFYKKTGLSNGFLDKVKDIGVSKLEYILNSYPSINPEWLLTGRGEMLKTNLMAEANNKVSEPERKPPDDKDQMIIELQQHRIVSLEKDLKEREREIDQLKKELKTAYDRSVVR